MMTDNVLNFPKKDPERLVWTCQCGCTSHHAHLDSSLECASCGTMAAADQGEWRQRLPAPPEEAKPMDAGAFKVTGIGGAEGFLRRQAKDTSDIIAAIILNTDGSASTWATGFEGEERRAWLDRQLERARVQLLPKVQHG